MKIEDQKKGWDVFIPNDERDSILFAYLRERRWNVCLLDAYNNPILLHHDTKFLNIKIVVHSFVRSLSNTLVVLLVISLSLRM